MSLNCSGHRHPDSGGSTSRVRSISYGYKFNRTKRLERSILPILSDSDRLPAFLLRRRWFPCVRLGQHDAIRMEHYPQSMRMSVASPEHSGRCLQITQNLWCIRERRCERFVDRRPAGNDFHGIRIPTHMHMILWTLHAGNEDNACHHLFVYPSLILDHPSQAGPVCRRVLLPHPSSLSSSQNFRCPPLPSARSC
jgi:hypothetical protein